MKPPSNARQISNSETESLLRFITFLDNQKMKKTIPQHELISDISDNGTEHRYTNGKPETKQEITKPTSEATPKQEAPQNISTGKPTISKEQFLVSNTHDALCSGLAYYSGGTYNRNGVGKLTRFVVVKGFGSWAIYTGAISDGINDRISAIMDWGDKVCLETHIKALVNCADIFDAYRF